MYKRTSLLYLLLVFCFKGFSQNPIFSKINFYDDLTSVSSHLKGICDSTKLFKLDNPKLPLAEGKESHLVAYNMNFENSVIDKVAFVFADNRLMTIECHGNVSEILRRKMGDNPVDYLGFKAYPNDLIFVNQEKNKLWSMTPEAAHLHLFAWNNPYLFETTGKFAYEESASLPDFIEMGADLEYLTKEFHRYSQSVQIDTIKRPDSHAQVQLNSLGIAFAGFPRKMEARFGNNKLNMLWVLTAKEEEDRVRNKLINSYGKPLFIGKEWEFFKNWTVGLRKDKPEVLFLTEELAKLYRDKLTID